MPVDSSLINDRKEGLYMKIILQAVVAVLFCYSLAFAGDEDFKKIDTNNDGKISRQEYNAAVIKTFKRYDKNGDGFLTKDELMAIAEIDAEKFMKEVDTNNDGKISQLEFMQAAEKRFKFLDKNGNGYIEKKEMVVTGARNKTLPAVFIPFVIIPL
jgi:Ca2+-binding EF-hand superfamily protein